MSRLHAIAGKKWLILCMPQAKMFSWFFVVVVGLFFSLNFSSSKKISLVTGDGS